MGFLRRARDKRTCPHSFVLLTVIFYKEEGDERWQAECRELGTASYGDTFEDTRERIAEAIELHLNTLEEVGERERFFKERKIKIHANGHFLIHYVTYTLRRKSLKWLPVLDKRPT